MTALSVPHRPKIMPLLRNFLIHTLKYLNDEVIYEQPFVAKKLESMTPYYDLHGKNSLSISN